MPKKKANTALVLEGGGFRCNFTAGVLDVLQEQGIYNFKSVFGVSAGAINAVSFKSHQIGRALRISLAFRDDRRFMSFYSLATTGNIAGAEFMYETIQNELDPCDNERFNADPMQMFAVASDIVFGSAAYLPVRSMPEDVNYVRASASLPAFSRVVELDGHRYLDGGATDSVPFAAALGIKSDVSTHEIEPAAKAVVVLTRERGYIKAAGSEAISLRTHRYDDYPLFVEALSTRAERYNAQREELWELEREGRVLVIAPEEPVSIRVNEHAGWPMLDLYLKGRAQAESLLDEIRAFIA